MTLKLDITTAPVNGVLRALERAKTLVLNADYRPISVLPPSVVGWQEAIKMLWVETVDLVEIYDGLVVRAPSAVFDVPSVLVNKKYVKHRHKVHFSKHNVFARDWYKCQYCGAAGNMQTLTYDHLLPRSKGGTTCWENIVTACEPCNSRKKDELSMKPVRAPKKPTYDEIAAFTRQQPIVVPDVKWLPYLNWQGQVTVRGPIDGDAREDQVGF